MSPRAKGRRYAGRGIAEIKVDASRASIRLPGPDDATVLPDPMRAHDVMRERYVAARGAIDAKVQRSQPRLTVRDVKAIANHFTFALRNDLPTIDAHDAAVIWEKWRKTVLQLRDMMRGLSDDDQSLGAGTNLDGQTFAIHGDLADALREPGIVFKRYCPWRSDWATFERVHPEAV